MGMATLGFVFWMLHRAQGKTEGTAIAGGLRCWSRWVFALIALNPRFIAINAQFSKNSFAILFATAAIAISLKLLESPSLALSLVAQICLSGAMMSKVTAWVVAIAMVSVFLVRTLIDDSKPLGRSLRACFWQQCSTAWCRYTSVATTLTTTTLLSRVAESSRCTCGRRRMSGAQEFGQFSMDTSRFAYWISSANQRSTEWMESILCSHFVLLFGLSFLRAPILLSLIIPQVLGGQTTQQYFGLVGSAWCCDSCCVSSNGICAFRTEDVCGVALMRRARPEGL